MNKATLIERIAELVREKKLEGISDLRDESDRQGMRIVIELKRDAVGDVVLNQLYRYTALQSSFGVNMVALNGGRPELMNLKDLLTAFVSFREEVISRRTQISSRQGARPRACPCRPGYRCGEYRRGDRDDPDIARYPDRPRALDVSGLAGRTGCLADCADR